MTIDAGPRILSFLIDGVLCDGGPQAWGIHPHLGDQIQGWAFLPPKLIDVGSDADRLALSPFDGTLRLFGERLLHGDILAAFRAWLPGRPA